MQKIILNKDVVDNIYRGSINKKYFSGNSCAAREKRKPSFKGRMDDQEELIRRLKGEGKSLKEVAEVIGCSYVAVTTKARQMGLGFMDAVTKRREKMAELIINSPDYTYNTDSLMKELRVKKQTVTKDLTRLKKKGLVCYGTEAGFKTKLRAVRDDERNAN